MANLNAYNLGDALRRTVRTLQVAFGSTSVANIAAGATFAAVAASSVDGFQRITGVCKSDKALTLKVFQGSGILDTDMETVTNVAIPANATEGQGASFSVEVVGSRCRIDVTNPGGADTTAFKFAAFLRGT